MRGFLLFFICAVGAAATQDTAITIRHKKHRRLVNNRHGAHQAHQKHQAHLAQNAAALSDQERVELTTEFSQARLEDEQLSRELKQARDNYKSLNDRFEDQEQVVAAAAQREQETLQQLSDARLVAAGLESQVEELKMGIGIFIAVLALSGFLVARRNAGQPSLKENAFKEPALRAAGHGCDVEAGPKAERPAEMAFANESPLAEHCSDVALASPFHDHAWLVQADPELLAQRYGGQGEEARHHDVEESVACGDHLEGEHVEADEITMGHVAETVTFLPTHCDAQTDEEQLEQHQPPQQQQQQPQQQQQQEIVSPPLGCVDEDEYIVPEAMEEIDATKEHVDLPCSLAFEEQAKSDDVLKALDALRHPQREGVPVSMAVNAELRAQLDKRFVIAEGLQGGSLP